MAKKISGMLLATVIIIAPLIISSSLVYEYLNPKLFAIEIGLGLVIAAVLLSNPLWVWKKSIRNPAVWGILVFLFTLVLSTLTSVDPVSSWFGNIDRGTGTFFLVILGIAAWAIGSGFAAIEDVRMYVLKPISISGALLVLSIYAEELGWGVLKTADTGGLLGNTSMAGTYLLITLFVTAYLWWSATSMRTRWLYGIITAVLILNPIFINFSYFSTGGGIFSLIGQARGAACSIVFGTIIALSVWGITATTKVKQLLGWIVLSLALLSMAWGIIGLVTPQSRVHNWFISQETDVRFLYWNIALKEFHHHPFLGTGPETYSYTYQHYFDPIVLVPGHSGEQWSNKPHNMYVQILSETGTLGMIGYIALFAGLIAAVYVSYKQDGDKKVVIVLSGLLAAYLLNNLIFFDTVTSYFLFFMIAAWIIGRGNYGMPSTVSPAWEKSIRIIKAMVVMGIILAIVIPQITKVHRAYKEFLIPLDQRATYYQKVEDTASYGSALFISQRADFSYEQVFAPNLTAILQQNATNRTIAATAIQGLIDTLQHSFQKYPPNAQGELAMGKLASIKMVIANAADPVSLATMKSAAEAAISASPTNPNAYLLLGQEYVYEQKYDDAYVQFDKARALVPNILPAHMALINLATMLHDTKKEVFYVTQAAQEVPGFTATAK